MDRHGPDDAEQAGIVCAALGGEEDERAALLAGALSRRLELPLTFADVCEPIASTAVAGGSYAVPPIPGAAVVSPPADLDRLGEVAGVYGRRTRIDAPRHEALRRIARDPSTELLVVRDEGGGPMAAALSGSAARSITREATAAIVLVPEVEASLPVGAPTIVCAVDDGPVAETVAGFAGRLAARLGAMLHVLPARRREEEPDEALSLIERCRSALPSTVNAEFHADLRPPAQALRTLASDVRAELVVLGRPSHGLLLAAVLGSVVHAMLRTPVAPVIVVPDADPAERTR
jgi:nucleotide-binding universal stress UspA family protein